MKAKGKVKSAAMLPAGGLVFGTGGGCVPDNFLIDTWGGVLTSVVDVAVDTYVLDPITGMLVPAEE